MSKCIVIGAGLSGLYTAYLMQKAGHHVQVLEARDRIGGRVHTVVMDEEENLTLELGAEWIGTRHHRLLKLCRSLKLPIYNHHLKTHLIYRNRYYQPGEWKLSQGWQKRIQKIVKNFKHFNQDEQAELNTMDWWHFLLKNHIPHRDLEIVDLLSSTDFGESIRFISALEVISDLVNSGGTAEECMYQIKNGNSAVAQALATKIGRSYIHLNHVVKAVEVISPHQVSVHCQNEHSYTADSVVISVPASVFSTIRWTPRLPEAKREAPSKLSYSRILKTAVLFEKRFWKADDFELLTDELPHFLYHATQNQPGTKGILVSYAVGDKADVIAQMSDEERVQEILKTLSIPFGDVSDLVIRSQHYYWSKDPWVRGAYALYERNLPIDYKSDLRAPLGPLHFCGEHTAEAQGFMEGALESAERVVAEIVSKT